MDLFGCLRIDAVKQILKTSLVLVIRKVHKLLKLLLKPVLEKSVVYTGNPGHVDANDSKLFHLISLKALSNQVYTG